MNEHLEAESPDLETLLRFVYEDLPRDQQQELNDRIRKDPDLAFAIEGMSKLRMDYDFESWEEHLAWAREKESEFDRKIAEMEAGKSPGALIPGFWMYVGLAAASLVILLLVFFPPSTNSQTPEAWVETALAQDVRLDFLTNKAVTDPADDSVDKFWQEIAADYNQGEVGNAYARLSDKLTESTGANDAFASPGFVRLGQYVQGLCLMRQKKWNEAIEAFEPVANDPSNNFTHQAAWQMGLAAYQAGSPEQAKTYFSSFVKRVDYPDDPQVQKAQEFLRLIP